jgi:hypothetical protein
LRSGQQDSDTNFHPVQRAPLFPELDKDVSAEGALLEALWILMKGVQLAFTDWIPNEPPNPDDARLMWDGMAIHPLAHDQPQSS